MAQTQNVEPNQYELTGVGLNVTYSTTSFVGKPQLTYTKNKKTITFTGDEIRSADTDLGKLISVSLEKTVDRGYTSLSVALPALQAKPFGKKQSFRTVGVITAHKTTVGGPVTGPLETYKVLDLKGTAVAVAQVDASASKNS